MIIEAEERFILVSRRFFLLFNRFVVAVVDVVLLLSMQHFRCMFFTRFTSTHYLPCNIEENDEFAVSLHRGNELNSFCLWIFLISKKGIELTHKHTKTYRIKGKSAMVFLCSDENRFYSFIQFIAKMEAFFCVSKKCGLLNTFFSLFVALLNLKSVKSFTEQNTKNSNSSHTTTITRGFT